MARRNTRSTGRKAAGQPNMPRRRNNNASARASNSTGLRTVNIEAASNTLCQATDTVVWDLPLQGSYFPGLKAQLDHAIEWRIRSARITFTSVKSLEGYSLAAILLPTGASWKPESWVALETAGGVIKPVKNSGWSTNNLGAQESWTNHANPAGVFYGSPVGGSATKTAVGVLTLHATIQVRGTR